LSLPTVASLLLSYFPAAGYAQCHSRYRRRPTTSDPFGGTAQSP
jgi:hypothetical protein